MSTQPIETVNEPTGAALPPEPPHPSRLRFGDVVHLGATGIRRSPMRSVLSALGIAIGIAAMIAVVGISTSSQVNLNAQLTALGTNVLTSEANTDLMGPETKLPVNTVSKVRMTDGIESASGTGNIPVNVYRTPLIDESATGGINVLAADLDLLDVTGTALASGTWLNAATAQYPVAVLGADAAARLGIVSTGSQVWLGGQYFTVAGVLQPSVLAPELDAAALLGIPIATSAFGYDGSPSVVYERVVEDLIDQVRELLPATVNPEAPEVVAVSRPSDALAAKYAADQAFTGLLVGLGSVALLVGGIGVANTMIISVLERRREIGLRRALGATRAHIRRQFLIEALLLSALGGIAGFTLGAAVTAVFTAMNRWTFSAPVSMFALAVGSTLVIGAIAGLYPAMRAARTLPTAALSS